MIGKPKSDKAAKELLYKFLALLLVASLALILFDVLTQDKDGRRQIVDENGADQIVGTAEASSAVPSREEQRLSEILSQIKGVGKTDVLITYQDQASVSSVFSQSDSQEGAKVKGVIVTAEGAGDPVVKNDIISAVASVFRLPAGSVMVFEKAEKTEGM